MTILTYRPTTFRNITNCTLSTITHSANLSSSQPLSCIFLQSVAGSDASCRCNFLSHIVDPDTPCQIRLSSITIILHGKDKILFSNIHNFANIIFIKLTSIHLRYYNVFLRITNADIQPFRIATFSSLPMAVNPKQHHNINYQLLIACRNGCCSSTWLRNQFSMTVYLHYQLLIVNCPLSIVHCPLSIVHYPLSIDNHLYRPNLLIILCDNDFGDTVG